MMTPTNTDESGFAAAREMSKALGWTIPIDALAQIIAAYISALPRVDHGELVEQLRAGLVLVGESETDDGGTIELFDTDAAETLMSEAADALSFGHPRTVALIGDSGPHDNGPSWNDEANHALQDAIGPAAWRYWQANKDGGGYWVLLDANAFPETVRHHALEPLYSGQLVAQMLGALNEARAQMLHLTGKTPVLQRIDAAIAKAEVQS